MMKRQAQKSVKGTNGRRKPDITHATRDFLTEGQVYAHKLYEEGMEKFEDAQKSLHHYSDEALNKVRDNPLTSVLVAMGVGFVIGKILKIKK